jgi:hypothetical protein
MAGLGLDDDQILAAIIWRHGLSVPYVGGGREPIADRWMNSADTDIGQLLLLLQKLQDQDQSAVLARLEALAQAEELASSGVSRTERACHRAARDAYRTAIGVVGESG